MRRIPNLVSINYTTWLQSPGFMGFYLVCFFTDTLVGIRSSASPAIYGRKDFDPIDKHKFAFTIFTSNRYKLSPYTVPVATSNVKLIDLALY